MNPQSPEGQSEIRKTDEEWEAHFFKETDDTTRFKKLPLAYEIYESALRNPMFFLEKSKFPKSSHEALIKGLEFTNEQSGIERMAEILSYPLSNESVFQEKLKELNSKDTLSEEEFIESCLIQFLMFICLHFTESEDKLTKVFLPETSEEDLSEKDIDQITPLMKKMGTGELTLTKDHLKRFSQKWLLIKREYIGTDDREEVNLWLDFIDELFENQKAPDQLHKVLTKTTEFFCEAALARTLRDDPGNPLDIKLLRKISQELVIQKEETSHAQRVTTAIEDSETKRRNFRSIPSKKVQSNQFNYPAPRTLSDEFLWTSIYDLKPKPTKVSASTEPVFINQGSLSEIHLAHAKNGVPYIIRRPRPDVLLARVQNSGGFDNQTASHPIPNLFPEHQDAPFENHKIHQLYEIIEKAFFQKTLSSWSVAEIGIDEFELIRKDIAELYDVPQNDRSEIRNSDILWLAFLFHESKTKEAFRAHFESKNWDSTCIPQTYNESEWYSAEEFCSGSPLFYGIPRPALFLNSTPGHLKPIFQSFLRLHETAREVGLILTDLRADDVFYKSSGDFRILDWNRMEAISTNNTTPIGNLSTHPPRQLALMQELGFTRQRVFMALDLFGHGLPEETDRKELQKLKIVLQKNYQSDATTKAFLDRMNTQVLEKL
jgi:hypothetical protein